MTQENLSEVILTTVAEIKTVLLGVPGTEDGGLVGDVRCIRRETTAQATVLNEHGEIIATIVARCDERHGTAPINTGEARRLRFTTSDLKKQWKIGSLITVMSALIYIVVEFIKSV